MEQKQPKFKHSTVEQEKSCVFRKKKEVYMQSVCVYINSNLGFPS